ncbi:YczE/YyaS/YitT family protein [Intestinibacter sp.]|uniref:YczE/YyaS/YitT family protein n=1 Tax=Intestinibacter sp. TaxID=1965304 RepID=UPI003F18F051
MNKKILKDIAYLAVGYVLIALAVVIMVNSNAGLVPWDVLHQGISRTTGITMGQASMLVGTIVIVVSIALGENLGWATIGNIFIPGILIDVIDNMNIIPVTHDLFWGVLMVVVALIIWAFATVLYLIPALGCGPRDGLMIALHKRTGKSIGLLRSIIEICAVIVGYLLGGTFGIGTIISAFCFGYLLEIVFKMFKFDPNVEHKMIFSNFKKNKVV